ncbi:MAG: CDP-alcohol phosphatidyltransferase family protein [Phycisphaerae bacterium]|nr:CDP-alcohol phosphatidyltransferase family protein [Phycisphaerae bacterium]
MAAKDDKRIIKHVPNALTIGRLVLTVVFLAMILLAPDSEAEGTTNYLLIAFILFVVTGLTDIVDGKVARMYNVTSKFGRIVDPLADKFLVCGAFICFAIVGQPTLNNFDLPPKFMTLFYWGTAGIIITRELMVTIIRQIAESRGVNFAATVSGKLKMFFQSFSIGMVMVKWAYVSREWGDWFAVVTFAIMLVTTVISGISAVMRPIK